MIGEIITSIGLVFDIVGAVVITEPIIRRFVKLTDQRGAKISDERDEARMNPDYEHKVTRKAKYGMVLLRNCQVG